MRWIVMGVLSTTLAVVGCSGGGPGAAPEPQVICEGAGYLDLNVDDVLTHSSPRDFDPWELFNAGTQLRGVNIFQRRTYPVWDDGWNGDGPVGPPYTAQDFGELRALGANVVNISHPGLVDEVAPFNLCGAIQQNLDQLLGQLEAADLFGILSLRTGPGRNEFTLIGPSAWADDSVWRDALPQDHWVDMWRYVARRYRNHPVVVAYDLMVEPNANEVMGDLWEPAEFYQQYGGTLADWNPLASRIITAIRQEDPDTPIIVGAMAYSAVAWLPHIEVDATDRVVFAIHQYAPVDYTHSTNPDATCETARYPGEPCSAQELRSFLQPVADVQALGIPVVVNEFGAHRFIESMAPFLDDQMAVFEELGIGHLVWQWSSELPAQQENDDFNFKHGLDPDHHVPEASNPLLQLFEGYWSQNSQYPSTVTP